MNLGWQQENESHWFKECGPIVITLSSYANNNYWELAIYVTWEGGIDINSYEKAMTTTEAFEWADKTLKDWLDKIYDAIA